MLGGAEAAKKMLQDLSDFAANTPFELTGVRQTAKQLLAYGIEAHKIIPTLKALGDVSA
jgi:putative viral A-type inclusion protein